VEGQRKGSVLYLHNDYLYRRDKERNGIKAFRCRRESCPARARQKNGEDVVNFFSSHNHGMEDIGVLKLKTELKKAAFDADARFHGKPDSMMPDSMVDADARFHAIHGKLHLHFVL